MHIRALPVLSFPVIVGLLIAPLTLSADQKTRSGQSPMSGWTADWASGASEQELPTFGYEPMKLPTSEPSRNEVHHLSIISRNRHHKLCKTLDVHLRA